MPESELLRGTVDLLILRALALQSAHGFGIARWIRSRTDDVVVVEGAALYQALARLERRKWISSEWGLSENNRKARYYSLTRAGKKQLKAESRGWEQYARAMARVLAPGAKAP